MKLSFEQQKVLEKALTLERRVLWTLASVGLLLLGFFAWWFLSGNWPNKFPLLVVSVVLINVFAGAIAWLLGLCRELRGVLTQLINGDPQALAQQYEKNLGLGDSESISA
jgi:hypothetical protein